MEFLARVQHGFLSFMESIHNPKKLKEICYVNDWPFFLLSVTLEGSMIRVIWLGVSKEVKGDEFFFYYYKCYRG